MSTCTVLIGTRRHSRPCGLPSSGDTCSTHRSFTWELPRTSDALASNAELDGHVSRHALAARSATNPVVSVGRTSVRASTDDGDYWGSPV